MAHQDRCRGRDDNQDKNMVDRSPAKVFRTIRPLTTRKPEKKNNKNNKIKTK